MNDSEIEALLEQLRMERRTTVPQQAEQEETEDFADDTDISEYPDEPDADEIAEAEDVIEQDFFGEEQTEPTFEEVPHQISEPMHAKSEAYSDDIIPPVVSAAPDAATESSQKQTFRSRLRSMMNEDITPPAQTYDSPEWTHQQRQHRYTVFGAILVVFALIGIFSTVRFAIRHFHPASPQNAYQAEVAEKVMPLVVMDCPMFQSAADLSDEQLLMAGIWSILTHGGLSKYPEELGLCRVPAADVDQEIRSLFELSAEKIPQHQTVGAANDLCCYYDATDNSYRIPTDILHFSYIPQVTKLEKDGGCWYAEVAYLPDLPEWQRGGDTEPTPSKIAKITLIRENNVNTVPTWQVSKMEQIS